MTLTASNMYTGLTIIGLPAQAGGTLVVNGSQGGSLTAVNQGTLRGTGTVGGLGVMSLGSFHPGSAGPGTLSVQGNTSFQSGSTYTVDLNGTAAGTYSRLAVTGNVDLGGANLGGPTLGYIPAMNDTFTIVSATGTLSGTFAGLPDNTTFCLAGATLRVNYTTTAATLTVVSPGTDAIPRRHGAAGRHRDPNVLYVRVEVRMYGGSMGSQ